MHFETQFIVTGSPQTVIEQFADVPLMASFLPGASVEAPTDDGSYPAALMASFGPKKIVFKGTLTNRVEREALTGVLVGQASADVRGARMAVTMNYRLAPAAGSASPPRTEVRLASDAQLTGVLAEFAKAGGVIVAEALIAEFARRFSAHVEAAAAGEPHAAPESGTAFSLATLVAVLWRRLKGRLARKSLPAESPAHDPARPERSQWP